MKYLRVFGCPPKRKKSHPYLEHLGHRQEETALVETGGRVVQVETGGSDGEAHTESGGDGDSHVATERSSTTTMLAVCWAQRWPAWTGHQAEVLAAAPSCRIITLTAAPDLPL